MTGTGGWRPRASHRAGGTRQSLVRLRPPAVSGGKSPNARNEATGMKITTVGRGNIGGAEVAGQPG